MQYVCDISKNENKIDTSKLEKNPHNYEKLLAFDHILETLSNAVVPDPNGSES